MTRLKTRLTWLYAVQLGQLSSVELCRYKHPFRFITLLSYTVTGRFLRSSAKWLTRIREWIRCIWKRSSRHPDQNPHPCQSGTHDSTSGTLWIETRRVGGGVLSDSLTAVTVSVQSDLLHYYHTLTGMHSKPRTAPHCRVLPPGELNGMSRKPLPMYSEGLMTITVTVFLWHCTVTNLQRYTGCQNNTSLLLVGEIIRVNCSRHHVLEIDRSCDSTRDLLAQRASGHGACLTVYYTGTATKFDVYCTTLVMDV